MTFGQAEKINAAVRELTRAMRSEGMTPEVALARLVNTCSAVLGEGRLDASAWSRVARVSGTGHTIILFRDGAVCGTFATPEPVFTEGSTPRDNL